LRGLTTFRDVPLVCVEFEERFRLKPCTKSKADFSTLLCPETPRLLRKRVALQAKTYLRG